MNHVMALLPRYFLKLQVLDKYLVGAQQYEACSGAWVETFRAQWVSGGRGLLIQGTHSHHHTNTQIPCIHKYPKQIQISIQWMSGGTSSHHHMNTNINTQIHKYNYKYKNNYKHKNTNSQIHKYTNAQIHKCTNTQIHKYANMQIHKYKYKYKYKYK